MAPFLSKRRAWPKRFTAGAPAELTLRATEPDAEPMVALAAGPDPIPVAWPIAAALAGLVSAGVGWVLVVGLTVLGWLGVDANTKAGSLSSALDFGTQLWVYANGAGLAAGGLHLTVIPWGTVIVFAVVLGKCTAFVAVRTGRRSAEVGCTADDRPGEHEDADVRVGTDEPVGPTAAGIGVLAALGYLAPLAAVALLLGAPVPSLRLLASFAAVTAGALWGSCRALGVDPSAGRPRWLRGVPTAVLSTQLVLLAAGAAVVTSGLLLNLDRVTALTDTTGAGVAGKIALLAAQLALAPNLLVWGAAYALGAGFGLGDGSVVAPASTHVGLLPGVPVFGAVPASGPGGVYQLLWLGAGVLAGLVAAWSVVRRHPSARFDETALVGGLCGVLGALVFTGMAWASSGDLGVTRLTELGPRLPELVVMAVSTLGLSGMVGGLVLGLWRGRPRAAGRTESDVGDRDPEATVQLDRQEVMSGSR